MHLPLISLKRILLVHRLVDIARRVDRDRHPPTLHIDHLVGIADPRAGIVVDAHVRCMAHLNRVAADLEESIG